MIEPAPKYRIKIGPAAEGYRWMAWDINTSERVEGFTHTRWGARLATRRWRLDRKFKRFYKRSAEEIFHI